MEHEQLLEMNGCGGGRGEETHQVMAEWRQIIYMSQVSLGLLDSLHTAVDGPHQGLLG